VGSSQRDRGGHARVARLPSAHTGSGAGLAPRTHIAPPVSAASSQGVASRRDPLAAEKSA